MRARTHRPRLVLEQSVLDSLCGLVQRKFYEGEAVAFAKDRKKLLEWAILWPAPWFKERDLFVSGDVYQQLLSGVIIEAAAHGNTSKIKYRPAWLRMVIQSHFKHHGEEIYERAKTVRAVAEHQLLALGKLPPKEESQVVPTFVKALRLLATKKRLLKTVKKEQMNLF